MPKLHVLLKKEDIDTRRLPGKVVVVLDVLFASSTIIHAFEQGIDSIWPALDAEDALRIAATLEAPMLAGEYEARHLPGFAPATPLALTATPVRGGCLVYATTNGTIALKQAAAAAHVYVGALSNARMLAAHVAAAHPQAPVLLVCAGSMGRFNLEDFYGAGHLAGHFDAGGGYALSDAARAAMMFSRAYEPAAALAVSRVGRMMRELGLQPEMDCAARSDSTDVIPHLVDGCLRRLAA